MAKKFIDKTEISDVMIERPISFSIKGHHYSVLPATLGKIQLTARLLESMGLNEVHRASDISRKVLEVADTHRNECLRLIAYSTLPGADCLDENKVKARLHDLRRIDRIDISTLLIAILVQDKTDDIRKEFKMDKEAEEMAKVMKVKSKDRNTLTFGGKSVWGTLIDSACERYGWSYQYVLWGVSYSNLQLLFADQIRQIFLSDDERKQIHITNGEEVVSADNAAELDQFIKRHSWK